MPEPLLLPDLRKLEQDHLSTGQTYTNLDLGTPREGFRWIVRRLAVYTADLFTPNAATAVVWIGAMCPLDSGQEPTFTHPVIPVPSSLPNSATWGDNQVALVTGEHLVVTIKSLSNGTMGFAVAQVEEWRDPPPRLPVPPQPSVTAPQKS